MEDDVALHIWLPPGYDDPQNRNRSYPVLYMFDGQNLFDVCGSMNHEEWQIDETLTALIDQQAVQPLIVVGIDAPDDGPLRGSRYVPFEDAMSPFSFAPHGDRMPIFLENELLPYVNQRFRTQVGRSHTAIGGASYGAVAALYALIMRPHVFGLGLIESPWTTPGNGQLVRMTEHLTMPPLRVAVGVGDNEASLYADKMRARDIDPSILNRTLARDARVIAEHLRDSAADEAAVQFIEVPEGTHSEGSWRNRFAQNIRFLFPPAVTQSATPAAVPYGANKAASGTFVHDGITFYYETYGTGEPLLMIHGNGTSIGTLAAQIEFFKTHRRVIVMDSRDQGRSGSSAGRLTYEKMADDQVALLEHLNIGSVDVLGWSDGGIEALLMGARHPDKVKKLVSMAANLRPEAVYPEVHPLVQQLLASITPEERNTVDGRREIKVTTIMETEPHLNLALLKRVTAPTLILSGDHDLIRLDHTVAIYEALPNAQLSVFPNSTHMVPYDDPRLFNETVERFLTSPFKRKDRIADTMSPYDKIIAGLAK